MSKNKGFFIDDEQMDMAVDAVSKGNGGSIDTDQIYQVLSEFGHRPSMTDLQEKEIVRFTTNYIKSRKDDDGLCLFYAKMGNKKEFFDIRYVGKEDFEHVQYQLGKHTGMLETQKAHIAKLRNVLNQPFIDEEGEIIHPWDL